MAIFISNFLGSSYLRRYVFPTKYLFPSHKFIRQKTGAAVFIKEVGSIRNSNHAHSLIFHSQILMYFLGHILDVNFCRGICSNDCYYFALQDKLGTRNVMEPTFALLSVKGGVYFPLSVLYSFFLSSCLCSHLYV